MFHCSNVTNPEKICGLKTFLKCYFENKVFCKKKEENAYLSTFLENGVTKLMAVIQKEFTLPS